MSQRRLTATEVKFLQDSLNANQQTINIRLREGEYQYKLVKAIASFQLELRFPDIKEIVNRLFGDEKTTDIQFIRKVQTILKKMEKSDVVRIVPKKNPWDLQRYGVLSYKFQDSDKNLVVIATDEAIKQSHEMLDSALTQQEIDLSENAPNRNYSKLRISLLVLTVIALYLASMWALTQPIINPIVFIVTFSLATASSLMLGKTLAQRW
jgi:hypothetical protein